MATAIVSGRVDVQVKDRADAYIHAAGLTVGDVIKRVWEGIARTGELPTQVASEADAAGTSKAWEDFLGFCDTLSESVPAEDDWLASLTVQQMKDVVAEGLVEAYEQLP